MILKKIIINKIKELKNSYKKINIRTIKFICFKKKNKFKKFNYIKPIIFIENKFFSPIYKKIVKKNIYYFLNKFKNNNFFSILTDLKYFNGHELYFRIIKKNKKKKIIKKDFLIEKYQLYENIIDENIILVIYNLLKNKIKKINKFFNFFNKEYIVELKSKKEIKEILKYHFIYKKNIFFGINNRNLSNFIFCFKKINFSINKHNNIISESGIKNSNFVFKYFNKKINNFLIGKYILKKNFFKKCSLKKLKTK
ncbi:hypothetical protein [Candidatus Vidania fulgoroideorum]